MNWFCRVQFIQSHLERERTLPARAAIWSRFNRALSGAGDVGLWKNYFWCALCTGWLRTRGAIAAQGTCGRNYYASLFLVGPYQAADLSEII